MVLDCPRCGAANPEVARYCRQCGLVLARGAAGLLGAGRVPHPQPLPPPAGFVPVAEAANLSFRWEAAGGGRPLLGTEPLSLRAFNGGYGLAQVALRIRACDGAGREVCTAAREVAEWPRGGEVELEIASYELRDRVQAVRLELVQAEFGPVER